MDDMISRQSVLALPRNRIRNMRGEIVEESINVADIETLPSAQQQTCLMSDSINRQEAINELCDNCDNVKAVCAHYPCKQYMAIEQLPPAQPIDVTLLPSAQPEKQHGRIFREIVVKYPLYSTCPEYKGKPYFSIKYTENGQEFTGYGIYTPEVVSVFLKEYFMPSAQPEPYKEVHNETD